MIPIQFKDTVARKYGYKDWESFTWDKSEHAKIMMDVLEESGLLYAQSKWDDACDGQRKLCYRAYMDQPIAQGKDKFQTISNEMESILNAPKPEFKP